MKKRLKSAEVAQGYPGFPYHQATTEDLTQRTDRFVVRSNGDVDYRSSKYPRVRQLNRPRTRFGRWFGQVDPIEQCAIVVAAGIVLLALVWLVV